MFKEEKSAEDCLQQKMLEEKMLREKQHIAIKELYASGTAKRAIARLLGIDDKTVRRHLKKVYWTPYEREKEGQERLLEREKEWLMGRMPEVGYNAAILFRELKFKGFKGSYETVKAFVSPYRDKRPHACSRYETEPGEQSQVDWGSAWVWMGEQEVKIHFFSLVLGYSRRLYAKAYLNEQFANLVNGHEEAFRWFGGMTASLLYDNARTMVTTHNAQTGVIVLNKQFEDFAKYYGFEPKFCIPYRPQTKGKIEAGVKYIKKNFLPGRRFKDLTHLNEELESWLVKVADQRIHGTTRQRPAERFLEESLFPLPPTASYQYTPALQRKVAQDALVSFETNRYSVPWRYVGACVEVRIRQGQLLISLEGEIVATHPLVQGKYQQCVKKEHYAGLLKTAQKKKKEKAPHFDPYESQEVEVRDLAVYEAAALGKESPIFQGEDIHA